MSDSRRNPAAASIERWRLPEVDGPIIGRVREDRRSAAAEESARFATKEAEARGYEAGMARARAETGTRLAALEERVKRLDAALHLIARPLEQLDATIGPLERGTIVHKALEIFVRDFPGELPVDAAGRLVAIADDLFLKEEIPAAVLAIWKPRFVHAAQWFVGEERERRSTIARSFLEAEGKLVVPGPSGDFIVHGRADRIDVLKGGGAAILDYKTGSTPTDKQVKALLSPQLPLEGAIAASGGFSSIGTIEPRELVYVRFIGGAEPGSWRVIKINAQEMSEKARTWLIDRVARYDQEATPYLTRAIPYRTDIAGDYDHLARVGEWVLERVDDWDP